jgi:hypothetical protein
MISSFNMTESDRLYALAAKQLYPAYLYRGYPGLKGWQERLRAAFIPCFTRTKSPGSRDER